MAPPRRVSHRHPRYFSQTGGGHTHPTSDIITGIFSVARGGTGKATFTTDSMIYFDGTDFESVGVATTGAIIYSVDGASWSVLDASTNGFSLQLVAGVPQWASQGSTHAFDAHTGTLTVSKIAKGPENTLLITRGGAEGSEPNWIVLVAADIPLHGTARHTGAIGSFSQISGTIATGQVSGSYTGITGVGIVVAGTWRGTKVASDFGGTGLANSQITTGDILFSGDGTSWSTLGISTVNFVLTVSAGGLPEWKTVDSSHAFDSHTGTLTPVKIAKGAENTLLITRGGAEGSEPNWIVLVAADIPAHGTAQHSGAIGAFSQITGTIATGQVSGSYTGITAVGTIAAGVWNGTKVASDFGGTGLANSQITTGDILFSGDGTSWTTLGISTLDFVLTVSGGGLPEWRVLPPAAAHDLSSATHDGDATPQGFLRANTAGTAWEIEFGGNTGDVMMLVSGATNDVWEAGTLDASDIGSGTFTGAFTFSSTVLIQGIARISSTLPILTFEETDQNLDEKRWRLHVSSADFKISVAEDDDAQVFSAYEITRGAAAVVTDHRWFTGTGTEGMRLVNTHLLIGTSSDSTFRLHVVGTDSIPVRIQSTGSSVALSMLNSVGNTRIIVFSGTTSYFGGIDAGGTGSSIIRTSGVNRLTVTNTTTVITTSLAWGGGSAIASSNDVPDLTATETVSNVWTFSTNPVFSGGGFTSTSAATNTWSGTDTDNGTGLKIIGRSSNLGTPTQGGDILLRLDGHGDDHATGLGTYDSGAALIMSAAANWTATNNAAHMDFYTRNTTGAMTGRWRINADGTFRPFADSQYAIGTNTLRPTTIFTDALDVGAGGVLAGTFSGNHTYSGYLHFTQETRHYGAAFLGDATIRGALEGIGWSNTIALASNLYYDGAGDPSLAANWRYENAAGGSNTAGGMLYMAVNGTETGVSLRFYTTPLSTDANDTPVSMTIRFRVGTAGMEWGGGSVIASSSAIPAANIAAGSFPSGNFQFADGAVQVQRNADHVLSVAHISTTGSPFISFYQNGYNGTRRSFIQHSDPGDEFIIASEYGAVQLRPGISGTGQTRLAVTATDLTEATNSPKRGTVRAANAALYSDMYSHGKVGENTTVFGRAGNKHHVILDQNRTVTITVEADGQELTLYIGADTVGNSALITWAGVDEWADVDPSSGVVNKLFTHVYYFERISGCTIGYVISTGILGPL